MRYYYQCPNHKPGVCSTKDINADYIENYVLDVVVEYLKSLESRLKVGSSVQELSRGYENSLKQIRLSLKNNQKSIDDILSVCADLKDNAVLKSHLFDRLNELYTEQEELKRMLESKQSKVDEIKALDVGKTITKADLLSNRVIAHKIISLVIKEINVDSQNDKIEVITF